MTQNIAWNWPVDAAAAHSKSRGWAVASTVFYGLGAAALMVAPNLHANAATASEVGIALVVAGVAISVGVLGKVLITRTRHDFN